MDSLTEIRAESVTLGSSSTRELGLALEVADSVHPEVNPLSVGVIE
jgi:hypothetical protein